MVDIIPTPYEVPRQVLPWILNQRGLNGIGVEVGVCRGIFSEHILTHWTGKKLYLVDPWMQLDDYAEDYNHDENLEETKRRMAPFKGRYEIVRRTSLQAAEGFPDATLDFCYIDANHRYEAVRDDLEAWYPKVKVGGLFAGDDYGPLADTPVNFGHGAMGFQVKQAVDEFSLKYQKNISIDWTTGWAVDTEFSDGTKIQYLARNWWLIR